MANSNRRMSADSVKSKQLAKNTYLDFLSCSWKELTKTETEQIKRKVRDLFFESSSLPQDFDDTVLARSRSFNSVMADFSRYKKELQRTVRWTSCGTVDLVLNSHHLLDESTAQPSRTSPPADLNNDDLFKDKVANRQDSGFGSFDEETNAAGQPKKGANPATKMSTKFLGRRRSARQRLASETMFFIEI